MTSSESNEEASATSMNTAVPGMVKTLKSLLDAAIRERLRLETLLEQVQEVTTQLETLMDQSENRLEQRQCERERLENTSHPTASPAEYPLPPTDRMIVSDPSSVTSDPQPAKSTTLPGQVASLRERVRQWEQERTPSHRDPAAQVTDMLRDGATTAQIAEKLQIPIGEVELMARLTHFT